MDSMISRASCCLLVMVLAACASHSSPTAAPEHAPPKPAEPKAAAPTPPPTPPVVAAAPALVLTPPPGWVVEEPAGKMRKAQYRLPHAEGDGEDAGLIVYYFGGSGGSREANVERWAGQFEQPDGSPSAEALKTSERTIAGLNVFDATLSGTYVAETAPGSGEHVNKPGWRMIASIVDTKEGPWYFKLVGPAATVAKWESSYETFVTTIRPGS